MRKGMLLATLFLIVVASCAGPAKTPTPTPAPTIPPAPPPTPTPKAGPVRGGTLVVAISANPDGLDPHKTVAAVTFEVAKSLYDTLVESDPQGNIVPGLAEKWEASSDGLRWTFYLRKGVKFHNGREMTSKDVKASFERILNPETKAPRAKDYAVIQSIETPDDYTVIFQLKEPQAAFLSNLAYGWAAIVPVEEKDLRNHPVGTGPFRFVEWVPDSHVKLERFPDYFIKDQPYLDAVIFKIMPDPASKLTALKVGEVDVVDQVPPQEVEKLKGNPEIKLIQAPANGIYIMALNNAREPFNKKEVRQAISYAVDKKGVIEAAQWGQGAPIGSHMPPVTPFYVDLTDKYPYNPEKARQLLAQAGYPEGFEVTLIMPQPYDFHIRNCEVIADYLKKIGIKPKLETYEWGMWLDRVYMGRDYQATCIGHTGRLDPDPFLNRYVSDSKENYMNYNNPRYDEIIRQAAVISDFQKRKELYAEAQRILAEDAVALYLMAPLWTVGVRKGVEGWQIFPIDIFDLRTVYKTSS